MHAAYKHPKLFGMELARAAGDRAMQIGSVCHAMMFGLDSKIEIIEAENYKKPRTRETRDIAICDGLLPILVDDFDKARLIVRACRKQLLSAGISAFTNGKPERTLVWQEDNGVWCRARLDWCPDEAMWPIDDYKTTAGSAHPEVWQRAMFSCGDDIQAAFYARGWRKVFGEEPGPFRFIVQEQELPYAVCVTQLTKHALRNAEKKIEHAIRKWRECLDSGSWPGYTMGYQIDIPAYREFFGEPE